MYSKSNILVSACLVGVNSKYNGKNNLNEDILKLRDKFNLILCCPEVAGKLSTPRDPSEIVGKKVLSNKGNDVTFNYNYGANVALKLCMKHNIKYAILKEKSPSCGSTKIYDGTFSGTLIDGEGVTTTLLRNNGIKVYSELEINKLLEDIRRD